MNLNAATPRTAVADTHGFPDPFAPRVGHAGSAFVHAFLATTLFRCWHIILIFGAWATFITVWNETHESGLKITPTLLTVFGTVLGFVISYRTTSSYERYNEGRRYWSQIILASRTFARIVWFHVQDTIPGDPSTPEQIRAKVLIEKKTVINLLEAFAVGVKHYLRGEDGIFYKDLYHRVKFLPSYGLPHGIPSVVDQINHSESPSIASQHDRKSTSIDIQRDQLSRTEPQSLPLPVSTPTHGSSPLRVTIAQMTSPATGDEEKGHIDSEENFLLPSRDPPQFSIFDIFPFSLLVRFLTHRGKELKGKKAARLRASLRPKASHNLPLEISLYLSSYISAMQTRKSIDAPTITLLYNTTNQLVDALVGLERILTTPIPWSYHFHLWEVTVIYVIALPPQIWEPMRWMTIPATMLMAFAFFGFLAAGEEIENPFGYDKNDLNMDHFTHNIIRRELHAITATAPPDLSQWVFSPSNDLVLAAHTDSDERVRPSEWLARGTSKIQMALAHP